MNKKYDENFISEIVAELKSGKTAYKIAKERKIAQAIVYKWKKEKVK